MSETTVQALGAEGIELMLSEFGLDYDAHYYLDRTKVV